MPDEGVDKGVLENREAEFGEGYSGSCDAFDGRYTHAVFKMQSSEAIQKEDEAWKPLGWLITAAGSQKPCLRVREPVFTLLAGRAAQLHP